MKTRLAAALLAAALAGCGGGISIGFGLGGGDDPPSISLALAVTTAAPGQTVRLAAAASDDDFVAEVRFYRVEPGGATVLLGVDARAPFEWDAVIPADALRGSTLRFFARAVDSAGQARDSETLAVTVS
jgi:hypothetical protein